MAKTTIEENIEALNETRKRFMEALEDLKIIIQAIENPEKIPEGIANEILLIFCREGFTAMFVGMSAIIQMMEIDHILLNDLRNRIIFGDKGKGGKIYLN